VSTTATPASKPVKPPADGWHWKEWCAELAGTAVLLFAVVTARSWAIRSGPPWSDPVATLTIIATTAGLAVAVISFSPLGRRSGAHLNPAVTVGFWLQNVTGRADLLGYCTAQVIGSIAGVAAARAWGPQVARVPVHWAVLMPATWMPHLLAAGIEAGGTFVQMLVVFILLTSRRYHQWAPLVASVMLAGFIIALAPLSGAAFSPIRALAPDVMANAYPALWIYFAGPVAGSVAAAAVVLAWGRRPITGKLYHDPAIECHMRCELPDRVKAGLPADGTSAARRS
jgi:aquaporin Z